MTLKPDIKNETALIESAKQAYNHLTAGRGVRVKFIKSGEYVLLTKPRTGEAIGLYNPATGRFLDPRLEKVPKKGTTRFKVEEDTAATS